MDRDIKALTNEEIVDSLDVLVLARVCGAENDADADGVFVYKLNSLFRVNDESVGGAVDEFLLDLKVSRRLLPANLDSYSSLVWAMCL